MAKRTRTTTRKPALSADDRRSARAYEAALKEIAATHEAELADRDKKHAEAIARKEDRIAQMSAEQQAAERKVALTERAHAGTQAQVKALTEEGNQLRGMVRNLENELARASGYMQAIEDAKPKPPPRTRTIEIDDESERAEPSQHDGMLEFKNSDSASSYHRIRKGWWER